VAPRLPFPPQCKSGGRAGTTQGPAERGKAPRVPNDETRPNRPNRDASSSSSAFSHNQDPFGGSGFPQCKFGLHPVSQVINFCFDALR
jgi:hypothetical protein